MTREIITFRKWTGRSEGISPLKKLEGRQRRIPGNHGEHLSFNDSGTIPAKREDA
jgi:hypothetical protein